MRKKVFIVLSLILLSLALVSCTNNYLAGLDDRNAVNQMAKTDPQVALDLAQQAAESGDTQAAVENTTQSVVTALASSTTALEDVDPTEVGSALNVIETTQVSTASSAVLSQAQEVLSNAASTITSAASDLQAKLSSGATISETVKKNVKDAAQTTVKAIATKHGFTMDNISSKAASVFMPKDTTVNSTAIDFIASIINTLPTNGEIELMIAMQKLARAVNTTPSATMGTFDDPMMAVTLSLDEIVHIFYQLIDSNGNGYLDPGDDIYTPYKNFLDSGRSDQDLQDFEDAIENLNNPFKNDPDKFNSVKNDLYDIIYNLKIGIDALTTLIPDIDAQDLKDDLDSAKSDLDQFFSSGFDVTSYNTVGELVNAIADNF